MVIQNACWIFAHMLGKNGARVINSVSGQTLSCHINKW